MDIWHRPIAGWRGVQWSAADWRAWAQPSRSILFEMPKFTLWLLALDWMHVKYLGHNQHVGSILSHLKPPLLLHIAWRSIGQSAHLRWNTGAAASVAAGGLVASPLRATAVRCRYLSKLPMFPYRKPPASPLICGVKIQGSSTYLIRSYIFEIGEVHHNACKFMLESRHALENCFSWGPTKHCLIWLIIHQLPSSPQLLLQARIDGEGTNSGVYSYPCGFVHGGTP